ncbi:MAG TPA: Rieske (2Fe-2S) protein [Pirellulales bacterium]|nr:Rieske (2Fe-2S) protein [Pirellulales bacterium]
MSRWIEAAAVAACPPGKSLELVLEDRIIAIFHAPEGFYALDGICPHQGGPLGKGVLTGCIVTCPWHGWQFDVRTGQHQTSPRLQQPCLPVKIEKETIYVDLATA